MSAFPSDDIRALVDAWIRVPPGFGGEDQYKAKLDILQRIVELGRMGAGHLENGISMAEVFHTGFNVDTAPGRITFGDIPERSQGGTPSRTLPRPHTPYDLQVPLLLHLVHNWRRKHPIRSILADFVQEMQPFLTPLDMESTKTGVPRIATNTRFAAGVLRNWGLLRFSREVAFKYWELTHLGLVIGSHLAIDRRRIPMPSATVGVQGSGWLSEPISTTLHELRDVRQLSRVLFWIAVPNADILHTMKKIQGLLERFQEVARFPRAGLPNRQTRQEAAKEIMEALQKEIPSDDLADDFAKDLALRDILRLRAK